MSIEIEGDILNCDIQYICHQCNCVTNKAKGLANDIFNKYPWADVYYNRKIRDKPGSIYVKGDGKEKRLVINLFGQFYPGSAKYSSDSKEMRELWFKKGLDEIAKIKGIDSIAFPYLIGCGMAGGKWEIYKGFLDEFAKNNPKIKVYIIKKI